VQTGFTCKKIMCLECAMGFVPLPVCAARQCKAQIMTCIHRPFQTLKHPPCCTHETNAQTYLSLCSVSFRWS